MDISIEEKMAIFGGLLEKQFKELDTCLTGKQIIKNFKLSRDIFDDMIKLLEQEVENESN